MCVCMWGWVEGSVCVCVFISGQIVPFLKKIVGYKVFCVFLKIS